MSIHAIIRSHRLRLGMTEQQLADRVGVTRAAVQQWEREGGTAPRRTKQADVAAALGISLSELLGTAETVAMLPTPAPAAHEPSNVAPSQVTLEQALEVVARSLNDLPDAQRDLAAQHLQTLARAPDSAKAMQALLAALHCHAPPMPLPESRDFQPPVPPSFLLKNKPTEHHS